MTRARTLTQIGALTLAFLSACPALSQESLYLINDNTSVRQVDFRFTETQTFTPKQLKARIATKSPGFLQSGWRASVLSVLPIVPDLVVFPFSPVELQKDLVRLERFYDRNGFLNAVVDYEVELDTSRNDVSVSFSILEGEPLLIDSLSFAGPSGRTVVELLDADLRDEWIDFRDRAVRQNGERLDEFLLINLQDRTLGWLRDRGHAFADASAETQVDSTALEADVRIKLNPGPRGHFADIAVEGAESAAPEVVLRELPFKPGDRFRQRSLTEGQRQIFGLNLFQLAAVDVVQDQPHDSTVDVIVRVREGPPRFLNALTGYYSDGGLTGSTKWTHRNFFGGARSFTATLDAQTGIGAVGSYPLTNYEARLSLLQPYLLNRRLSATAEPFARYRDDVVEEATIYGLTTSLLYDFGPLRTATLSATASRREVGSDSTSLVNPASLLPGEALRIAATRFRLSAVYGAVDDPLNPRSGFILRPSATLTGLLLNDVSYAAAGLSATGYLPLGERTGIVVRASGGGLFPTGSTDPALEEDYLALRDELVFAGGTNDVRGWGDNLLGPKFIDFTSVDTAIVFSPGGDLTDYYNDRYRVRYRPVGAQGKASASVELNVPLPLGPGWGAGVFVDVGRVWKPADGLYDLYGNAAADFPNLPPLIARFQAEVPAIRYGAGAGIQYMTPIGFITFGLGVKLNPSFFDLRDPRDILAAADIEDLDPGPTDFDLSTVEPRWQRRLQFHLSIGQRF